MGTLTTKSHSIFWEQTIWYILQRFEISLCVWNHLILLTFKLNDYDYNFVGNMTDIAPLKTKKQNKKKNKYHYGFDT